MFGIKDLTEIMPYMTGVTIFLTVIAVWFAAIERSHPLAKKAKNLKEREKELRDGYLVAARRRNLLQSESKSLIRKIVIRLNLLKGEHAERFENRLAQAGWRGKDALMIFLFIKLCMPFVAALIALLILWAGGDSAYSLQTKMLMVLSAVSLGYYLPELIIKQSVSKRRQSLELALPDSLDLMVICAEAGLSLDATLKRVATEMAGASAALADELALTATELGILPERRKALENLISRTDMPQIKSVVNTLLQAERYGTPLAQSLSVLGEEYRQERMMKAEEKAAKLPAILTVPMIIFIMPSLFIVLLGPAIMRALDSVANM